MLNGKRIRVVMHGLHGAKTLEQTYREVPRDFVDEVILVDDGSHDATAKVANELGLTTFVHKQNLGYGRNQKTCYREALRRGADIVIMLHPDYQYSPNLIVSLAGMIAFGEYDVALASRILGVGALKGGMPLYKYIANRFLTFFQNVLMKYKLSEYHTGYRAFSRTVLDSLSLEANTISSYWPTFTNGFVNYDDKGYVGQNQHLQPGLTLANILWAFRSTEMANWHPVTWISHMADVQLFGLHPSGHHAISLLFHAVNAVLLFFLLRSATGFLWRSFTIAALFALHPLNVECVAWISERKSLLCTFFLFLALFAYGWYVRKPGVGRLAVVALLFALGLAAKPMVLTLPFALLLLDYWPFARLPIPLGARDSFLLL